MSLLLGRLRKNKWQLKRLLRFETHFLSWVCAYAWEGWGGREMLLKLPWWFNFINPPLSLTDPSPTSLCLSHPHFLPRTKKANISERNSLGCGSCGGFHQLIWARFGWMCFPLGIPAQICRYTRICWAQKLHKTMFISGILWNFTGWKSLEWKWRLALLHFQAAVDFLGQSMNIVVWSVSKCQIPFFCTLNSSQVGSCLA